MSRDLPRRSPACPAVDELGTANASFYRSFPPSRSEALLPDCRTSHKTNLSMAISDMRKCHLTGRYCTMILASQDANLPTFSTLLLNYWICPMPAYVQERLHFVLPITNDKELVSGNVEIHKLANFFEPQRMSDTHPALGEDGTLLKLVHALFSVPGCGQCIACCSMSASLTCCGLRVDAAHVQSVCVKISVPQSKFQCSREEVGNGMRI